jgi:hypothetical protein
MKECYGISQQLIVPPRSSSCCAKFRPFPERQGKDEGHHSLNRGHLLEPAQEVVLNAHRGSIVDRRSGKCETDFALQCAIKLPDQRRSQENLPMDALRN